MEGDAACFFLLLNFVSILVFLQEPEKTQIDDWMTDLLVLMNSLDLQGEMTHTALDSVCEMPNIVCMMNSSSLVFAATHTSRTFSLSSS